MLKRLVFVTVAFFVAGWTYSQSDHCSYATQLSVGVSCNSTSGTTSGATESIPGCTGNADDDVWYKFTATSTSHVITVNPSSGMDAVVQLFKGPCSSLVSLVCKDNGFSGVTESITYSNFIVGQEYRIRVYHYGVGAGTGNFNICVTTAPSAPTNDNCSYATTLNVNQSCSSIAGTLHGASTSNFAGCAGDADDDVWYKFVATAPVQTVTASTSDFIDLVLGIYKGGCSTLQSITCVDNSFLGGTETTQLVGLTIGATYYIRVYDYYTGNPGNFSICVTGAPTPTPSNDEPCNAIAIPTVTSTCQYMTFSNVGATKTTSAPAPTACTGANVDQTGGFGNPSNNPADVWFSITVPPTGHLNISVKPNMGTGSITDGVMALYSGTCGNLTQITCSENYKLPNGNYGYPGGNHNLQPMIDYTGLTPGSTVYLRYWGYANQQGSFGFCVTTATNDACSNALYICDINGYSASTSPGYTPDRPGNMRGNAEKNNPPTYTWTPGTNQGGVFGSPIPGVPGSGAPLYDVRIENNSWIKFTAAATTVTLNVSISDCFVGNYPSGGIQMQIFSANNCTNFVPVSNFEEDSQGFTITAQGLTAGSDYLLMVDGYAGDICNYTISANSGVQFPQIPPPAPICLGQSVTLTAPPGATTYEWQHNGSTNQSVSVTPGTTQTYYCEVTGLCGQKQTLSVEVQVKPSPMLVLNMNDTIICAGDAITINASGASSYLWNTNATTSNITVSPTSQTTYTVTGTVSGCSTQKSITVSTKPKPNVTLTSSNNNPICAETSVTLSAGGASSYSWSTGASTSQITVSPTTTTTYSVTGTTNGCSNSQTFQVVVKPKPNVSINPSTTNAICSGETITLSGTGATSYSWNSGQNIQSISVAPTNNTSYTVTGTTNGCTDVATYTVMVNQPPAINGNANATPSDCGASTGSISGLTVPSSGISSTIWTNSSNQQIGNTVNVSNLPAGSYTLTVTNTNGCVSTYGPVTIINPNAPTPPQIITDVTSTCEGGSINFSTPTVNNATYSWTGPDGFITSNTSFSVTNFHASDVGNYCLTITVDGCTSEPTCQAITLNPNPTLEIYGGEDTFSACGGNSVDLSVTGANTYTWSGPNGFEATGSSIQIPNFGENNVGVYTVTGTDANGCSSSETISGDLLGDPTIELTSNTSSFVFCNGIEAVITASGAESYEWLLPDNSTEMGSSLTISEFDETFVGEYLIEGTDENRCSTLEIFEIFMANPSVIATLQDSIVCPGDPAYFSAIGEGVYFVWGNDANTNLYEGQSFELTNTIPEYSGWYHVLMEDEAGCLAEDSVYLEIEAKVECLFIPDLITPNDDNLNDTWTIVGLENFKDTELSIYNRWGNLTFEVDDYQNDWGGEVNRGAAVGTGKVPVGTYFYILTVKDAEGDHVFKGYIEVQY